MDSPPAQAQEHEHEHEQDEGGQGTDVIAGSPSDFLKNIVGKKVKVRIGSGVDYHGLLTCLDGYMNVALEQTEEYANGRLTGRYGECFLRGNNVLYISALEELE